MSFSSVYYKYVLQIGARLDGFTQVRDSVYRFRCPFCGDSKKNKTKARGHFFENSDGDVIVNCFNCGYSSYFEQFLKTIDISLYNEFKFEKFGSACKQKQIDYSLFTSSKPVFNEQSSLYIGEKISSSKNQSAIRYLDSRCVDHFFHDYLYHIKDIRDFTKTTEKYKNVDIFKQSGLIFPFFTSAQSFGYTQFRSLESKFFMVFDVRQVESTPRIWGLNIIDFNKRVFVFEGIFDATMIPNSLALSGIGDRKAIEYITTRAKDVTFVLDNDYDRNKNVKKQLDFLISNQIDVVIYDRKFAGIKDSNEAVMKKKFSKDSLEHYFLSRTFTGLKARLELARNL